MDEEDLQVKMFIYLWKEASFVLTGLTLRGVCDKSYSTG